MGALTALSDAHAASGHWENAYRHGRRALRVVERAPKRDERRVVMLCVSLGHIADRRDDKPALSAQVCCAVSSMSSSERKHVRTARP